MYVDGGYACRLPLLHFAKRSIFHVVFFFFLKIIKMVKLGLLNKMFVPFGSSVPNSLVLPLVLIIDKIKQSIVYLPCLYSFPVSNIVTNKHKKIKGK